MKPTGKITQITWTDSEKVVISWNDVFTSPSALVYEISIGTRKGGSDILQWVETMDTRLEVFPLQQLTDYYITITAINAGGLFETIQHVIFG